MDDADCRRFHRLMRMMNSQKPVVYKLIQSLPLDKFDVDGKIVAIGAYVLMGNHFHLLIKESTENGLSAFMQKLLTGYTKYFNKKYKRVGPLFQSRFKAEHVENDEYLKYLYAYIHLNPVKLIEPLWKEEGIRNLPAAQKYLEAYRYSSYEDYAVGKREESAILTPNEFPDYFEKDGDFEHYVKDWLQYKDEVEIVAN